jgi:hypothetical protein
MTRYEAHFYNTEEDLSSLVEPVEGWLYGFHMTAWTKSGVKHSFATTKMDHAKFVAVAPQMESMKQTVNMMLKGDRDAEDGGVVSLGQIDIRGDSVEAFQIAPVAYEPVEIGGM